MAQWLQEAARRTRRPSSSDAEPGTPAAVVQGPAPRGGIQSIFERIKWPLLAALLAIAYLQYFYADVMLQIAALPAIVFFLLINGQMPPV
jgi:hypothetical protein